ncbi:MAG: UDP-N-acetylmuramoyl-tripeptide--D-alanyl-D-alanine ligase [Ruminococcus sp.]|nr:UDP-N-acetylmuramoyl-tripeptide--D-alanyl-D-alanine ligase [Ruminococcus sp.]
MDLLGFARNKKAKRIMKTHKDELLSIRQICDILHIGYPNRVDLDKKFPMICCFEGVFIKDCLFVHYERDEDTVAHNAMKNGARALLCSHQIGDYPCIIVDDVLKSLNRILQPMYDKIRIPTTVITGSCGKTTTKNYINCVYSSQYNTFCNVTNGNTFEYVGFEIQRFDKKAELFVQEVNESDPFNAKNASEVLKPQIACITNMDKSHIGELGSEENIMRAICDITAGMDKNGIVIINGDDPNSSKVQFSQKVIKVSIKDKTADCFADNIKSNANSLSFDLHYLDECVNITLPISGVHNIYNAQMAYVCGRIQGIPSNKIVRGLLKYKPLGFRQNTYSSFGTKIYADCYNASAKSIALSIKVIDDMKCLGKGRKIAVLGDIGEIDGFEDDIYRNIAESISNSNIDVLITYGEKSQKIHDSLTRDLVCYHENNMADLVKKIKNVHKRGDCILFKASRSMHLDVAIRKAFPYAFIKGMAPVFWIYFKWTMRTL